MQAERNHIYHLELFDLCDAMADESVDMILCDLPYGVTAIKKWDTIIPIEPMWEAFKRIIKPRGAIVLTATEPFASKLRMSNLDMYKYDWVWIKSRPTGFANAKKRPLKSSELVLTFNCVNYFPQGLSKVDKLRKNSNSTGGETTGKFKYNEFYFQEFDNYPDNLLYFDSVTITIHPTQKPVKLFEYLIKTYTRPGELVFDPCVGSGTTAVAARNTERDYICGDFLEEYATMARERVQNSDPFLSSTDKKTGLKQLSLFEE